MRAFACLFLLSACGSTLSTNENTNNNGFEEVSDTTPPELAYTPITESMAMGADVPVTCVATDDESGVVFVRLYFKNETDDSSAFKTLQLSATGNPDEYAGAIPGDEEQSGGMDYYLEAIDAAQNVVWAPEDGPDDPYHFRVYVPS